MLTIYSKTGGKNGKHAHVVDIPNIVMASYIAAQTFEHLAGSQFRRVPQALMSLQAQKFAQIPSACFLCVLENTPRSYPQALVLSSADHITYTALIKSKASILAVVKQLSARKKRGVSDAD